MNSKKTGRRRFLQGGAAMVGMAVAGVKTATSQEPAPQGPILPRGVRPLSERSPFEKIYRTGTATAGLTPLQNGVIDEDTVVDQTNLAGIKIPSRDPRVDYMVQPGK